MPKRVATILAKPLRTLMIGDAVLRHYTLENALRQLSTQGEGVRTEYWARKND